MYMDNYYILAGIFVIVLILINKFRYREVKDYQEYLKSKHWKRTREKALKRYGYKCMICSRKDNLNVHHNTYKNLRHEHKNDLVVLCSYHHKMVHNKLKNDKKIC